MKLPQKNIDWVPGGDTEGHSSSTSPRHKHLYNCNLCQSRLSPWPGGLRLLPGRQCPSWLPAHFLQPPVTALSWGEAELVFPSMFVEGIRGRFVGRPSCYMVSTWGTTSLSGTQQRGWPLGPSRGKAGHVDTACRTHWYLQDFSRAILASTRLCWLRTWAPWKMLCVGVFLICILLEFLQTPYTHGLPNFSCIKINLLVPFFHELYEAPCTV